MASSVSTDKMQATGTVLSWLSVFRSEGIGAMSVWAQGPTADDLTNLIGRLVQLDSIDLAENVKFRAGLGRRFTHSMRTSPG